MVSSVVLPKVVELPLPAAVSVPLPLSFLASVPAWVVPLMLLAMLQLAEAPPALALSVQALLARLVLVLQALLALVPLDPRVLELPAQLAEVHLVPVPAPLVFLPLTVLAL